MQCLCVLLPARCLQTLGFVLGTISLGLGFQLVDGQWETTDTCARTNAAPPARCCPPRCLLPHAAHAPGLHGFQPGPRLALASPPAPCPADHTVHRNLGVACTVLGFTQFSALVVRPKKGDKYRFAWELWHAWVGRAVRPRAALGWPGTL